MQEKKKQQGVELSKETVKQMLSLYEAVNTAEKTYPEGAAAYRMKVDLIQATAHAKNVEKAFQTAAEAVSKEL